jgi:hypothetical protein
MDCIYVLVVNGDDWEDMVMYVTKEEAIEASKQHTNARVEVFRKSEKGGYVPSYNYYKNGEYVHRK